ncbi:hypothetical protein T484DRAFT_1885706 [Baffinella frigidus]|nr:hypothetical protein T484DRAFT_1885706 [Cryptophyta sp. CCMP2293]
MAAPAAAFAPGSVPTLRSARAPAISMQNKVDILDKVEQLQVLTAVSQAGLLSKLERSKTLSKLEAAGALSTVEKILPLADKFGAISLLKNVVNVSPSVLTAGAAALALAPPAIIALVPDSNGALIAAQAASVPLFLAPAASLFFASKLLKVIQGDDVVDLSGVAKLL